MKERYDVVVVGAGPSGLLAAKAVAENGFDAAVVERKEKIEVIGRTCGQTLLPPNDYFFGDLFHYNARDKRFCFPKSGLSFPYSGPIKNLYDWYMYSPGMKRMHFGYPEGYAPPIPGMLKAPIALTYDKEVLTADLPSFWHVADTWENYEKIAAVISRVALCASRRPPTPPSSDSTKPSVTSCCTTRPRPPPTPLPSSSSPPPLPRRRHHPLHGHGRTGAAAAARRTGPATRRRESSSRPAGP